MRKLYLFLIGVLFLVSCTTMVPVSTTTVQAPKFTTIDNILKLEVGMSYSQVISTLGSNPYDINDIVDGKTTCYWFYKKIERKEEPKKLETKDGATSGTEVIDFQEKIYITFNNGKLESLVTDSGLGKIKNEANALKTETTTTMTKQSPFGFLKKFLKK